MSTLNETVLEGVVILDLATGKETRVAAVKSMQVPAKGGAWLYDDYCYFFYLTND